MDEERELVESELTSLLNRALRSVPYVKLDSVNEVIELFQKAVDLMESNLDFEDSDAEEQGEEDDLSASSSSHQGRRSWTGEAAELVNSMDPKLKRTMAEKLIGSTVTRDYSSPSSSKRSLGGSSSSSAAANNAQQQGAAAGNKAKGPILIGQNKTTVPNEPKKAVNTRLHACRYSHQLALRHQLSN
jgi:hypothetical protein